MFEQFLSILAGVLETAPQEPQDPVCNVWPLLGYDQTGLWIHNLFGHSYYLVFTKVVPTAIWPPKSSGAKLANCLQLIQKKVGKPLQSARVG